MAAELGGMCGAGSSTACAEAGQQATDQREARAAGRLHCTCTAPSLPYPQPPPAGGGMLLPGALVGTGPSASMSSSPSSSICGCKWRAVVPCDHQGQEARPKRPSLRVRRPNCPIQAVESTKSRKNRQPAHNTLRHPPACQTPAAAGHWPRCLTPAATPAAPVAPAAAACPRHAAPELHAVLPRRPLWPPCAWQPRLQGQARVCIGSEAGQQGSPPKQMYRCTSRPAHTQSAGTP